MKPLRKIIVEARDPKKAVKLLDYIVNRRRRTRGIDSNANIVPISPWYDSDFHHPAAGSWYRAADAIPQTEHIPVNKIRTRQFTIGLWELKQKILNQWPKHDPKYPVTVHTKDKHGRDFYHLIDGNHRVAAARIRKDPTIEVKVIRGTKLKDWAGDE